MRRRGDKEVSGGTAMSETLEAMKRLEERIVAWARERDDIRAVLVVGSWARSDHPADEWSDLDIGFTTTHPERYLASDEWLAEIADVWLMYPDPGGVTRHVLFEGGLDAGFAPIAHNSVKLAVRFLPALRRLPLPSALRNSVEREVASASEYVERGVRVVLDKDDLAERFLALLPQIDRPRAAPSMKEFVETVNQFWFEAVWTAKHLRRGELWHAKCSALDGRMKELLLRMMAWHALAARGPGIDTWESGRFLEEWGDPRALRDLRDAFGRYDEEDVWRALIATMDLFRWLASETGQRLGYSYPSDSDGHVTEWVKQCNAGRGAAAGRE
jgi:aminoglycoside 6-adenylyltransferase